MTTLFHRLFANVETGAVRIVEANQEVMELLNGSIDTYDSLLTVLGLITSLVLVVVLVLKEIFRAYGAPKRDVRMRILTILTPSLFLVFVIILTVQLLRFLD